MILAAMRSSANQSVDDQDTANGTNNNTEDDIGDEDDEVDGSGNSIGDEQQTIDKVTVVHQSNGATSIGIVLIVKYEIGLVQ